MRKSMKTIAILLLALALFPAFAPAFAQPGRHEQREFRPQMPPAERRMGCCGTLGTFLP